MVAEQHPLLGGVVVRAVIFRVGRRFPGVIEHHDPGGNERTVVPVRNRPNGESYNDQIKGIHVGHSTSLASACSAGRSLVETTRWVEPQDAYAKSLYSEHGTFR